MYSCFFYINRFDKITSELWQLWEKQLVDKNDGISINESPSQTAVSEDMQRVILIFYK